MAADRTTKATKRTEGRPSPSPSAKVTNYLLDQQLKRLERDFLEDGGLRERMTRARLAARGVI